MVQTTLATSPEWGELVLVKGLSEKYREALKRVYNYVFPLLKTRPVGGEEFTDHDIDHSIRIVERIGKILPPDACLNSTELYVLLLCALLHDLGMWTTKSDALSMLDCAEFVTFCKRGHAEKLNQVKHALASARRRWLGELGLQRLVAAYHRSIHAQRFGEFILNPNTPNACALRTLIDDPFVESVSVVCEAHSWRREDILDSRTLRAWDVVGDLVNHRYLAELLRLGDLLDMGWYRISTLVWDYLVPMNHESEAHWRKEATLRIERCEPDLIRITGVFDVDKYGICASDAYILAREWLSMLKSEINGCALVLHSRMEDVLASRCTFGRLVLEDEVSAKGLILDGELSFQIDRDRILALLGDEIYSQGSVFVRELLQNSVDATRAQMIRDHREQILAGELDLPLDAPWEWPHEITGQDRYAIDVKTGKEEIDNDEYTIYSITDRGIGMTPRQIRENFLQIGKSYYQTPQFNEEFTFPPISHFGIGFLSCLSVADRIEVVTRSRAEPYGLRLFLTWPCNHFIVEKAPHADYGTCTKIWVSEDRARNKSWDMPPILCEGVRMALGFIDRRSRSLRRSSKKEQEQQEYSSPEQRLYAGVDSLSQATLEWAYWIDFTLRLNDSISAPKSVRTSPVYVIGHYSKFLSLPVCISSRSGDTLINGSITIPDFPAWFLSGRLPPLDESWFHIACFRALQGFWSSGKTHEHNPELYFYLVLNYVRIPAGMLAASRVVRTGDVSDLEWAIERLVRARLNVFIHRRIKAMFSEAMSCFAHVAEHIIGKSRGFYRLLLPCRTRSGLRWLRIDDAVETHKRVILVPYGLAWKRPWDLDVPCLGIPFGDSPVNPLTEDAVRDAVLVCLENNVVGYLWPIGASKKDLTLFKAQQAQLPFGTYYWSDRRRPRSMSTATRTNRRNAEERNTQQDVPEENPWTHLGLDLIHIDPGCYNLVSGKVSQTAQEIIGMVSSVRSIEYPESLLHITIDRDTADWVMNGVTSAASSFWATCPHWPGEHASDCIFQRYCDRSIKDSDRACAQPPHEVSDHHLGGSC